MKNCLLVKSNKINKPLSRLTKKIRPELLKSEMEVGYYRQFYRNIKDYKITMNIYMPTNWTTYMKWTKPIKESRRNRQFEQFYNKG